MVNTMQIQNGVARFIESDVAPHMGDFQRIAFSTVVGMYLAKLPKIIEELGQHSLVVPLEVIRDNNVDIDTIYTEFVKHMDRSINVKVPMLGTLTFTREDVDNIYNHILRS